MYTTFRYFPPFTLYFGSFVWRPLFKFRAKSYKKSRMCHGILGDDAKLLLTNGCFLSNHMPFPYVTNQNLVHIFKNCSRYWETANHSACLICAIKMASLDDEGVFSLVASKSKIFSLNTHQKRVISEVAKRGKDVFVNLPTGYGKSLI